MAVSIFFLIKLKDSYEFMNLNHNYILQIMNLYFYIGTRWQDFVRKIFKNYYITLKTTFPKQNVGYAVQNTKKSEVKIKLTEN